MNVSLFFFYPLTTAKTEFGCFILHSRQQLLPLWDTKILGSLKNCKPCPIPSSFTGEFRLPRGSDLGFRGRSTLTVFTDIIATYYWVIMGMSSRRVFAASVQNRLSHISRSLERTDKRAEDVPFLCFRGLPFPGMKSHVSICKGLLLRPSLIGCSFTLRRSKKKVKEPWRMSFF